MGASMSWLATTSDAYDSIKSILNVSEDVHGAKPSLVAHRSKTDWLFLFETRDRGWTFENPKVRASLSAGRSVYFFLYETHVMFASAALWENGREVWSVTHSSEDGIYHLAVSGKPPASFEAHKVKRIEEQDAAGGTDAEVDYIIEVPLDLSEELTGYHPEESDDEEEPITLYSSNRSLLARLFGK